MARYAGTLVLLLQFVSFSILPAAERLRVVVNELDANGVSTETARVVSDHLRTRLIETRRFVVPEREKMEAILEEQAMGVRLGECVSQECAIEIGRLLQANKMVVGTVSQLAQTWSIAVRFLDLGTGAAEFSAEEKCQTADDLFLAAERLAARIVAFVPQRGRVVAVNGDNIIIDLGETDGVTPGMTFRILRVTERVPGFPEEEPLATARSTAVQENWSRLELERNPQTAARRAEVRENDVAIAPQVATVEEIPRYAFLTVFSRPVGAEVYVDNLFQGRTRDDGLEVRLAAGRHEVRVAAPAHRADERTVDLQPNQRVPYIATLEPRLPRKTFALQITDFAFVRQRPDASSFRSRIDGEALQGLQLGFGRIHSFTMTELGASWTHGNMIEGDDLGYNEVHRLSAWLHAGIALRMGLFIPYGGVGYEIGQFMFNTGNVFSGEENLGQAGRVRNDGWYWVGGVYIRRWLHVSVRSTWGRPHSDLTMIGGGINLSGF